MRKRRRSEVSRLSEEDLRRFVRDFCDGSIFSDQHIPEGQDDLLPMIFMVFALGPPKMSKSEIASVGLIYEHLSAAGPRSINGYPIFTSCRFLHKADWERARLAIITENQRRSAIQV